MHFSVHREMRQQFLKLGTVLTFSSLLVCSGEGVDSSHSSGHLSDSNSSTSHEGYVNEAPAYAAPGDYEGEYSYPAVGLSSSKGQADSQGPKEAPQPSSPPATSLRKSAPAFKSVEPPASVPLTPPLMSQQGPKTAKRSVGGLISSALPTLTKEKRAVELHVPRQEAQRLIKLANLKQVKLPAIEADGLEEQSLSAWLTKKGTGQEYNGQYYFESPTLSDQNYLPVKNGERKPNPQCLRVRNLNSGGYFSESVFAIETNASCGAADQWEMVFVIKSHKTENKLEVKGEEQFILRSFLNDAIAEIAKIMQLKDKGFYTDKLLSQHPNLPRIILSNDFFYALRKTPLSAHVPVQDINPVIVFSVIKAAKGKLLKKIIENGKRDEIQHAMRAAGTEMATLHLLNKESVALPLPEQVNHPVLKIKGMDPFFKSRYVHGDFHMDNGFFDETAQNHQLSLIDNSDFYLSQNKERPIYLDLFRMTSIFIGNVTLASARREIPKAVEAFSIFCNSYIDAYPPEQRETLRRYMINVLKLLSAKSLYVYPVGARKINWGNRNSYMTGTYKQLIDALEGGANSSSSPPPSASPSSSTPPIPSYRGDSLTGSGIDAD